ncbi:MAG: DUF3320 domain-containing protein [Gammaproteobacteria bacterium]|nr:DUF3320 domain-containing protein [Gammaproteobacteria bacterium]
MPPVEQPNSNNTSRVDPRVAAVVEDARQKLVDTGTRNRLVHVNRKGRGRFLTIVNERADEVFRMLHSDRRKMRFHPAENDIEESVDVDVHFGEVDLLALPGMGETDESRFTDRYLDTTLGVDALQKRLLQLARDARTAEEEQGINILFLAIGFLQWFEDERSEFMREAPLVLLPVELVRNERTSTYDIRGREDDLFTNLPLQARIRDDFGLSLPDVDADDEWSPSTYFERVREAVSGKHRWSIDEHGMQLGFFSFAKQLMQRDLQQDEWPEGRLSADPTMLRLLVEGFEREAPLFRKEERLDPRLASADMVQVIDADAPQTRVIEEVRSGRNLIVQGPPGTGKSQTITNVIAAAVHNGKTVLFMAEKMAALDVVHDRLKKCRLGHLCLELHSRHANKREVLQEIDRTLRASEEEEPEPLRPVELQSKREQLNRIADALHREVDGRGYTAYSAIADVVGFIGRGRRPPRLKRDGLANHTRAGCELIAQDIRRLAELLTSGPRRLHPFAGCRKIDLTPVDQERLREALDEAVGAIEAARSETLTFGRVAQDNTSRTEPAEDWAPQPESSADIKQAAALLGLLAERPAEAGLLAVQLLGKGAAAQLAESLAVGAAWASAKHAAEPLFRDQAWGIAAGDLEVDLQRGEAGGLGGWLARWGSRYRRASRQLGQVLAGKLPLTAAERADVARRLHGVQRRHNELADEKGFLESHLGALWRGERTDFAGLADAAKWIARVEESGVPLTANGLEHAAKSVVEPSKLAETFRAHAATIMKRVTAVVNLLRMDLAETGIEGRLEEVALAALGQRFRSMATSTHRYDEWCQIEVLVERMRSSGLDDLIQMVDEGALNPSEAAVEFEYACAEARLDVATRVAGLHSLQGLDRHELVRLFATLDVKHIDDVREFIRARHLAHLPTGAAGEMGVIRGEIARKRRHMPIRRLVERAGVALQRIKPVFLMSPISIAQFLPPKALRFDLLVVDEASQVKPEDALGAIARCDQIVVVGDQKQLPPTSFFDRLGAAEQDDEDDALDGVAPASEMESILSLCEARGVNAKMLEWHYRSRDPSLIRISNEEFYDLQLILPPSPLEPDASHGLSFERVPGVYATRGGTGSGRPGTNRIEAEHVVQAVCVHAECTPDLSLGLVTFSKAQADMVTELLEYERRTNAVLNEFLREGHAEDAFVKNIENVQGDERDVIFISVGYGPTEPGGRLNSMRFGPINAEGGERRLNVLFTRARARCRVFASFDPGDIDLSPTARPGPRILRQFLEFAATGQTAERLAEGLGPDSPFEEDVATVIRSLGYLADHQVGSAGFRIDIGVRHPDAPGRYLLAVECDGASYHGALSARERDRHRQQVLEGMLWTFHRIWSTDWFHRRKQEIQRLENALQQAKDRGELRIVSGANVDGRSDSADDETPSVEEPTKQEEAKQVGVSAASYRVADVTGLVRNATPNDPGQALPEPHEVDVARMADVVLAIVEQEGPVHLDLVARRVAEAFDKGRTGARILTATRAALIQARRQGQGELLDKGGFWLTRSQSNAVPVRSRAGIDGGVGRPKYLPPMEVLAGADWIERECGRIDQEDLIRELARLLGFRRTGAELRRSIAHALAGRESLAKGAQSSPSSS